MTRPSEAALDALRDSAGPRYAGFWIRVGASVIDTIWTLPLIALLAWSVYGAAYFESERFVQGPADVFITYVLPAIVTIGFWIWKGATPGKILLGLRVVDADSLQAPARGRLVARYLGYFVSLFGLMLGFVWVAFDRRKQGWHDKIARTVVVHADDL